MSLLDLAGTRGLVVGIANASSIAYGCAKAFHAAGAALAITHLNAKAEAYVRPLAEKLASAPKEDLHARVVDCSQAGSTLDAAALCKMADRGQITGGIVAGPLAFDDAVSEEAAKIKSIASPVAGRADILLVPDLEAGNMLVTQLGYLASAQGAGIVLGARIPIILTSRADTVLPRMASCAVAPIAARGGERGAP